MMLATDKLKIFNITPINTDVTDLQKFEEKAIIAKSLGATHIFVSEVIKSTWFWDRDKTDPYPNWGMLNASLFKIIVPDELKPFYPTDYADKNLELVKQRTAILRRLGLKGAVHFCEPYYMPEEVFIAHPSWRGPRCDHPRRARNAYYSPCLDNEEVLSLYREAMAKLCTYADIDYVYLHTNDSGAGICWSDGLYVGTNGPEACRDIPLKNRILNYFRVFKEGAKQSARDIFIETNSNIGVKENAFVMDEIWPFLEDNMAVNFKTNKGVPLSSNIDVNHEFTFAPVRNVPMIVKYLELLDEGYHSESKVLKLTMLDDDLSLYERIIRKFFLKPIHGYRDRANLLYDVALEIVTAQNAQKLVDSWYAFYEGFIHYTNTLNEGMTWTSVNQRLLNRPFVLFPHELTPAEKDYYRNYQFQAQSEQHAADLLDQQGSTFIKSYQSIFMADKCFKRVINCFKKTQQLINEIKELAGKELIIERIELLIRFFFNNINAMWFQHVIDTTDFTKEPSLSTIWPANADVNGVEYERLTRAEIDNTYQIIKLITGREREMLVLAPTAEQEDIFWLSPDIVNQLHKKIRIMLNHQLDGKRVFASYNK